MEDKACYEYHVLSHEAICIFVTLRRPIRTRGQTTHYADNALFDERKSRSLTFDLPSSLRFPHFYEKERRNCQAHTSYALGVPLGNRATGYLFFSEMQIRENYCSILINIGWYEYTAVKLNIENEFHFYI